MNNEDIKTIKDMILLHPNGTHAIFANNQHEGAWLLTGTAIMSLVERLESAELILRAFSGGGPLFNTNKTMDELVDNHYKKYGDK